MPDLETRTLVCVRPAITTVSPSATSSSVLLLLLSISVPLFVKFTSEFDGLDAHHDVAVVRDARRDAERDARLDALDRDRRVELSLPAAGADERDERHLDAGDELRRLVVQRRHARLGLHVEERDFLERVEEGREVEPAERGGVDQAERRAGNVARRVGDRRHGVAAEEHGRRIRRRAGLAGGVDALDDRG